MENDPFLKRVAVAALGLIATISLIGVIVLSMSGNTVPDALIALGSGALGGLTGILVPSGN